METQQAFANGTAHGNLSSNSARGMSSDTLAAPASFGNEIFQGQDSSWSGAISQFEAAQKNLRDQVIAVEKQAKHFESRAKEAWAERDKILGMLGEKVSGHAFTPARAASTAAADAPARTKLRSRKGARRASSRVAAKTAPVIGNPTTKAGAKAPATARKRGRGQSRKGANPSSAIQEILRSSGPLRILDIREHLASGNNLPKNEASVSVQLTAMRKAGLVKTKGKGGRVDPFVYSLAGK